MSQISRRFLVILSCLLVFLSLAVLIGCKGNEICYTLYVLCTERNPGAPCGDCLQICIRENGEWPFSKCRIPDKS